MQVVETILGDARRRQLAVTVFLIGASIAAGYGIYQGKLKILAILGLITLGVFLRQASFANAYLLTILCANLAVVRFAVIQDEFEIDKWIALAAMSGLAIAAAIFAIRDPPWPKPIHAVVLGLVGVSAWSFTWSVNPPISFAKAGVFGLALIIAFIGIWSWARTVPEVMRIAESHVDSVWMVWPLSVALLVTGVGVDFIAGRFRSIYNNPNNLGFWASLTVPLLFGLAFMHPLRWRRITCAVMVGCAAICTVLSGSRGGMVGAGLGCGLYCLMRFPRRTIALATFASIVLFFLLAYEVDVVLPDSLQAIIRPDTIDDLSDRRVWWQIGLLIWAQRPFLGHGFGLSDMLFAHYGLDQVNPNAFAATVHNSYLEAGLNIGWIGLILLLAVQTWSCLAGLRCWWRDKEGALGLLALTLTCVAVAVSAHAAIESVLFAAASPWTLPYWVTLALIHRLAQIQSSERKAQARAATQRALSTA